MKDTLIAIFVDFINGTFVRRQNSFDFRNIPCSHRCMERRDAHFWKGDKKEKERWGRDEEY